jgi:hypothetical protein
MPRYFVPKESTFNFDDIDRGKIICLSMPQRFAGRAALHQHAAQADVLCSCPSALRQTGPQRERDNLVILWADEAQKIVTASERRDERLQRGGCASERSAGNGRRRDAILCLANPADGRRAQGQGIHRQHGEPDHVLRRRRGLGQNRRRHPRQTQVDGGARSATPVASVRPPGRTRTSTTSNPMNCAVSKIPGRGAALRLSAFAK